MSLPGLTTLPLPMPWELGTVNVHLVDLDDGFLLVDAGLSTPECFAALEAGLAQQGIGWRDIRTLLITHLHPDHVGLATKIRELTGARLLMHRLDVEQLGLAVRAGRPVHFDEATKLAGVPQELRERMLVRLSDVRRDYHELRADWELEGGERVNVKGESLEVVWTPGHSLGHVCLYSPEHHYLIAGDHLLEKTTPNVGWRAGMDTLGMYLDSLRLLEPLDIDWVIPSHGAPFQGHRERIQAIIRHHDDRCQTILAHLADGPHTIHELVAKMWLRRLSSFHHHFAVMEILAHVEYLRRRGPVMAEARPDGALNFFS